MALSAEYRTKFAALHQQALATPYEWRILKSDVKQFTINTEQICAFFLANVLRWAVWPIDLLFLVRSNFSD